MEKANEVIVDAELQIGAHKYRTNWIVSDCRYDVMLGMPWHFENNPKIDYHTRELSVDGVKLETSFGSLDGISIQNLGVKKFRSMLRKNKKNSDGFVVFQVLQANNINTNLSDLNPSGDKDEDLEKLIAEFNSVFRDELPDGLPPVREIDHKIEVEEGAKPPHRGMFQLSPAELIATKEYITDLLKKGKIRPSKSPYGAPLFFVKQKGKLRGVIDYRALNRIAKHNNAPIPRTDEMFDRLGRAKYFSKLDLKAGFHQIRLSPEDVEKTAFKTKYGHFEYLVMPMGLRNAPATFQALMNTIFRDCIDDYIVVYLDDILIYSDTREEHLAHLRTVLSRLKANELFVGQDKYELMTSETEFLGLRVGRKGVSIGEERKKLINEWPKPSTVTDLRSFLGLAQFFRRFIKGFSEVATPLTNLTRKNSSMKNWDEACSLSFEQLKKSLVSAPIMMAPNWKKSFKCHTDASQVAVGGTLTQQGDDGNDRVISYFSKRLSPAEENYSANDRELLGLIYFLRRFRCYLEGSNFEVLTDNQVLKHFFSKTELSRREAGWLDFLGQFGISKLSLVKGKIHILGDVPSRAPHASPLADLNNITIMTPNFALPDDFESNYKDDPTFKDIYRHLKHGDIKDGTTLDRVKRLSSHFRLNENVLLYDNLICVPRKNRKDLLHLSHDNPNAGHFGYAKTLARLGRFHWPNKREDVYNYCRGCTTCQLNKDGRTKPYGIPQPLEIADRRWGSVSMDFITHLPLTSAGYDCITTFVDRFTKRIHIVESKGTDTATDVANCFFDIIFKLHGLPDSLVSDRDPKFTSKFWSHLMARCGIQSKMSTSTHPQTDGSTEIMNRMIGNYLRCYCNFHQENWDQLLTSAEFAYNSSRIETLKMSPFELDLGWAPKSPVDTLCATPDDSVQSVNDFKQTLKESFKSATFSHKMAQARQSAYNSKRYRTPSYKVGDMVFISRRLFTDASSAVRPSPKLTVRRVGPFRITELIGKNAIRLDLPDYITIHPVVNVEHTTKAFTQPPPLNNQEAAAQPFVSETRENLIEVSDILAHRQRHNNWHFLTQFKNTPAHEAEWQPLSDFLDDDGTITEALHNYITKHNILTHLH